MLNNFTETELSHEQWKDIEGYDGMYQVSDLGRVRSLKFGRVKVLRPKKLNSGYLMVGLSKDGKQKQYYIHRLVAQAFIENDDETKIYINHRDECKQNNRIWNIEYCTPQYNSTYNDIHHRRIVNRIRSNYKRNAIKDLYNPEMSINENIKVFRTNGISCSSWTVIRLRKDLGLIDHKIKLDKIKPLCRPDLTYNENLDIFKANGVECSSIVIKELRRDLGLIKPYRPRKKPN